MEGVSTGEGTYDVNVLLTGREITGIPAFKWSQNPNPIELINN
jgi:hypothetical protein